MGRHCAVSFALGLTGFALGACSGSGNSATDTTAASTSGGTAGTGGSSAGGTASGTTGTPGACDLGPQMGMDNLPASTSPPCDLTPAEVPMFVVLGFDDNGIPEGMQWSLDMADARTNPDGSAVRFTYYNTSSYAGSTAALWLQAHASGHEVGNHTETHAQDLEQNVDQARWDLEVGSCHEALLTLGIPAADLMGFRTPFLGHSEQTLVAVENAGYVYDCSLEEGYEDITGTNYRWPYTLDNGSPGNSMLVGWGTKLAIQPHPGLWELPVYAVIAPPDDKAAEYGLDPGLRTKLQTVQDWFDPVSGQITGFDYNMWILFEMEVNEVVATLKYTLDQRLAGNRAPFLFGAHTDEYGTADVVRRAAIEEFLDYALSLPDVRVVPARDVLAWMRNPKALPVGRRDQAR